MKKALVIGMFDPNNPGAFEMAYERVNMLAYLGFSIEMINVCNFTINIERYIQFNKKNVVANVYARNKGLKKLLQNGYDIYWLQGVVKEAFLVNILKQIRRNDGIMVIDLPAEDIQYEFSKFKFIIKLKLLQTSDLIMVHSNALKEYLKFIYPKLNIYYLSYNITVPKDTIKSGLLKEEKLAFIYMGRGNTFINNIIKWVLNNDCDTFLIGTDHKNFNFNKYSDKLHILNKIDSKNIFKILLSRDFISVINYDKYFMDQPQKMLRYLACGIPFVTNRFLGIIGFLNENICLFAEREQEYYDKLKKLISDQELRSHLKLNAKKFAMNNILTDSVSKKFLEILKSIHL
jgi:glycosyltransferase involved in cell wall biosynthesis